MQASTRSRNKPMLGHAAMTGYDYDPDDPEERRCRAQVIMAIVLFDILIIFGFVKLVWWAL